MVVFAVYRDNGLDYEDHDCSMVRLCSTQEKALAYVEEEKQKWLAVEDEWVYENPEWFIKEVEVI